MRESATVLIAVPDLVEQTALVDALNHGPYRTATARDADEVVRVAETQRPSVVFLGRNMGGPDAGLTLCRHLKAGAITRHAAVVMVCGRNNSELPPCGGSDQPDEVLVRPVLGAEALVRLRAVQRLQRFSSEIMEGTKLDSLTGTFNNAYLMERLKHEVLRAERYGRSLALVLVDVDGFSTLNKRQGTTFGDLVLREVARALTSRLRGVDLVARTGPDDYTVLLPETSLLVARPVAERLRLAVETLGEQIANSEKSNFKITASLGVAGMPHPEAKDVPSLLHCARAALGRAREGGGNRTMLY